ncbi:MAG: HD domain-containing protein [Armatimonadetes bacterium]|nr:HD domain-containing protein [Armatimonadota bacterium]
MMNIYWDWGEPPDPRFWQLLTTLSKRETWAIEHGLLAAKIAALTAQALTLTEKEIEQIAIAGLLHDVGKITIPKELLQKPKPLTEEEYAQIQRHPSLGARVTSAFHLQFETIEAIRHHHERFDGKGYPFGKSGSEIPFEGRIVAVAEMLSATLTPRWYRPPLSPTLAIERLEANISAFDQEIAKAAKFQLPKLFGSSSLASLSFYTKPVSIERLIYEEEISLWHTINTFVNALLCEIERMMGQKFCQAFINFLNEWLKARKIPIGFHGLKPISKHKWWQTLGELALFGRTLLSAIYSMLGQIVGSDFASDWFDAICSQLPEQVDAVGLRYELWIWKRNENLTAVKSR